MIAVALGSVAITVWLAVMVLGAVAILEGSMSLIRVDAVLNMAVDLGILCGFLVLMKVRGELPKGPTPEDDEREAASFYEEQLRSTNRPRPEGPEAHR